MWLCVCTDMAYETGVDFQSPYAHVTLLPSGSAAFRFCCLQNRTMSFQQFGAQVHEAQFYTESCAFKDVRLLVDVSVDLKCI